jgi:uncharacterized protein YqjF (DUF2071 family)
LDVFDGSAWITLAPFLLSNLRVPGLPAVPWLSRFPETNLRTYVCGPDGKPGIWFFTLEAERLAAVIGARITYGLPYRWARMSVTVQADRVRYSSERHPGSTPARTRLAVRIGEPLLAGDLDHFLTARFRLYTRVFGRIGFGDIEHPPWPLQAAEVATLDQDLTIASGISPPQGEPLVHFSRRVDVRFDRLRLASRP